MFQICVFIIVNHLIKISKSSEALAWLQLVAFYVIQCPNYVMTMYVYQDIHAVYAGTGRLRLDTESCQFPVSLSLTKMNNVFHQNIFTAEEDMSKKLKAYTCNPYVQL